MSDTPRAVWGLKRPQASVAGRKHPAAFKAGKATLKVAARRLMVLMCELFIVASVKDRSLTLSAERGGGGGGWGWGMGIVASLWQPRWAWAQMGTDVALTHASPGPDASESQLSVCSPSRAGVSL